MRTLLDAYESSSVKFEDSGFAAGEDYWPAPYVYKQVKKRKLKAEKVYLRNLDLSRLPWSDGSITTMDLFLYHSVRVQNADHSLPIILCWDGFIMEGWHRVVSAVLAGELYVFGYRFES